jgi:hypothetical protein
MNPALDVAVDADVDVPIHHTACHVPGLGLPAEGVERPSPRFLALQLSAKAAEGEEHFVHGAP